ncbi:ornithine cyclodeaminase family protein [Streptomyces sioyaensis]|uniref:ornithine cyclodeaminase family protein n=1 Tax=Streptomyces sioyaensis TaxID=67364 RepID=UPI0037B9ACDF
MLVLGRSQVEALLDIDALIDALASAMADLSAGRAAAPDRVAVRVPERDGFLAAMPGHVPSAEMLMTKLVSVFPHNGGGPLPTHQALIVAFDPHTGEPTALLDGTAITAARTAAGSALSARLLAREDASVLALLGTGAQARSHAAAMCRVRPIRQIRVAGRDRAKAAALADLLSAELQVPAASFAGYAEALDGADIAAATTHAVDPVIRRSWLSPGVHVTSVGFNPDGREIDDATIAEALVCVESRQAALAPFPAGSNDLLLPLRAGLITEEHIHAELGELLTGQAAGRTSPDQITLYKSVGVAVQDAAAAALIVAAAREQSAGTEIRLA